MAADNSSCASMGDSSSCRDVSPSGPSPSIISNRQASGTPASPKHSIYLDGYPSSSSAYSLTSAPTSDCETPPETPARGRSVLNLGRIPDHIPESDFNDGSDLEGWFSIGHQHGSKNPGESRRSTALLFSPRRWRKRFTEAKQSPEPPIDTKITPENSPMSTHVPGDVNPRPWLIPYDTLRLNSQDLGSSLPRVSHSPTVECAVPKQATPTQETIGCSTDNPVISLRTSKRARCPPPLDVKSISSYNVFASQAKSYDANETKSKKRDTTELGLGLPSITGGRKPTRMLDDNYTQSQDPVGFLHPTSRPCLLRWRSSSLRAPEISPGPASAPPLLRLPPAPQLRPTNPVDLLDHIPSPLELPSPSICAANSWKAQSAPACQMYFDRTSRSSSARTHRPLSGKAPTPTAITSHPSSHTRLVVPPAHRRASSNLKEAIASLPGSGLHSPIPPRLVGTPYLDSVSSPFSPHFQPHQANRRVASEVLRQGAPVDVDEVDEHWIDVNMPLSRILPEHIDPSSLIARQSSTSGGRVGKGPSGRRKKPPRRGAKNACSRHFTDADAERTHSTLWTVHKVVEVVAGSIQWRAGS